MVRPNIFPTDDASSECWHAVVLLHDSIAATTEAALKVQRVQMVEDELYRNSYPRQPDWLLNVFGLRQPTVVAGDGGEQPRVSSAGVYP
jgi:hypothetical protein